MKKGMRIFGVIVSCLLVVSMMSPNICLATPDEVEFDDSTVGIDAASFSLADTKAKLFDPVGTWRVGTSGSILLIKYDEKNVYKVYEVLPSQRAKDVGFTADEHVFTFHRKSNSNEFLVDTKWRWEDGRSEWREGGSAIMTESNQIEVTDDKTRTWVRVEVEGGAPPASAPAASADAPEEEWNKTFGGSDVNEGYSVQQTKDGGYIITGWTSPSYDELSVWLIKTDSKGKEQWSKTFDRSDLDIGNSVQQTKDGGYIITGWTSSYGPGLYDLWLIKTDSRGNKQWDKTFGGSGTDEGYSVQQTTDGGYIITGYAEYMYGGGGNVLLIKVKGE